MEKNTMIPKKMHLSSFRRSWVSFMKSILTKKMRSPRHINQMLKTSMFLPSCSWRSHALSINRSQSLWRERRLALEKMKLVSSITDSTYNIKTIHVSFSIYQKIWLPSKNVSRTLNKRKYRIETVRIVQSARLNRRLLSRFTAKTWSLKFLELIRNINWCLKTSLKEKGVHTP